MTLAGCSGAAPATTSAAARQRVHPDRRAGHPAPTAADTPAARTSLDRLDRLADVHPAAGRPGHDAPGTDDPNGDLGDTGGHPGKQGAKTSVPTTAVLDTQTVTEVAGGAWTASAAPADSCTVPRPTRAVATRSSQLAGVAAATGSHLVETVSTHRGVSAAVAAVHALERRLTTCHADVGVRPAHRRRVGAGKADAADGTVTVVTAAAVDGVTFVLSGWGPVTAPRHWSALTDIALGSTCVASIEGCH